MFPSEEELRKINEEVDSQLSLVEEKARLMERSYDDDVEPSFLRSNSISTLQESTNSFKTSDSCLATSCVDGVIVASNDNNAPKVDMFDEDIKAFGALDPKVSKRMMLSRIESLSKRLQNTLSLKAEAEEKLKNHEKKYEQEKNQMNIEISRIKSLASSERKKARNKVNSNELDNLRAENQSLKKEVNSMQSIIKDAEAKSQAREVRLKRALESVEKFKQLLLERKSDREVLTAKRHTDVSELRKKIKDLEKEKTALRLGFQKQVQLIDILKRQKALVEASRTLDFTEREFENILEAHAED